MNKVCFVLLLSMISIFGIQHPGYSDVKSGWMDSSGRIIDEEPERQPYKEPPLPEGCTVLGRPGKFSIFKSQEGFGLVDQSGKVVIKPAPDYLSSIGDDLFMRHQQGAAGGFLVMDGNGKQLAFFDRRTSLDGKHFSEGLIAVNHGFAIGMNYCDKNGKPISDQMFTDGGAFSEGLANVRIATREQSGGGYIEHSGKFVIGPFRSAECSPFADGIGIVSFYTITPEGSWLFKRGAVDKTGKFIIAANYSELSRFAEKFFLAKSGDRFELLDFSGSRVMQFPIGSKAVVATKSSSMSQLVPCGFSSTKRVVGRKTEPELFDWGYSDMKGKLVIAPKFCSCEPFENGLAIASVKDDDKVLAGLIDESGSWKVVPKYQELHRLSNGHIQYTLEEKTEVANEKSDDHESHRRVSRQERFYELLKSHDVIGMTVAQLQTYLGDPIKSERGEDSKPELLPAPIKSMIQYDVSIEGPHCGNGSMQVQLGLDKSQRVCGWRLNGMQSHGHWYTENVVFDDLHDGVRLPRPKI